MSFVMKQDHTWLAVDDVFDIVRQVCHLFPSSVSRILSKAIKKGDWSTVSSLSVDPRNYRSSIQFAADYQLVSWLKKAEFLPGQQDLQRRNAVETFWNAERSCLLANTCLTTHESPNPALHWYFFQKEYGQDVFGALNKAREIVRTIVGTRPRGCKQRFGPGATSMVRRGITLPDKYAKRVEMTPELYPHWRDVCGPTWCKTIEDVSYQTGSRIAFVPKNAKTDRTIGVEPHLNIYAQLGVGAELRELFRPWIDLNVGQDRNRELAAKAHLCGLSTIDFSSASDTVSRGIVEFLFPPSWVEYFDKVRSHRFVLDDREYVFEKHSSMGNGYTFELESIIFYALARAVSDGTVSVYGDDVILPAADAGLFIKVSQAAGFKVNRDKSFITGSFFESCGADFFNGVNVRPRLLRKVNPTLGFKLHNDLRHLAVRFDESQLDDIARSIRSFAPSALHPCHIPFGGEYGNAGFEVYLDEARHVRRAARGFCGFSTKALKFTADQKIFKNSVRGLLAALDTGSEQSISPVRNRGIWSVGWLTTFGSWPRSA